MNPSQRFKHHGNRIVTHDAAPAATDPDDDRELHLHVHHLDDEPEELEAPDDDEDDDEEDDTVEEITRTIAQDDEELAEIRAAARDHLFDRQQAMQTKLTEMNENARAFWGGRR